MNFIFFECFIFLDEKLSMEKCFELFNFNINDSVKGEYLIFYFVIEVFILFLWIYFYVWMGGGGVWWIG